MAKTAAEISQTGYARPEVLVDTQWVADHLNDPKLKIVEVDVVADPARLGNLDFAVLYSTGAGELL